jgi:hypothetical protein
MAVSGGKAEYTTLKLAWGSHSIAATYEVSTDCANSSASLTQRSISEREYH